MTTHWNRFIVSFSSSWESPCISYSSNGMFYQRASSSLSVIIYLFDQGLQLLQHSRSFLLFLMQSRQKFWTSIREVDCSSRDFSYIATRLEGVLDNQGVCQTMEIREMRLAKQCQRKNQGIQLILEVIRKISGKGLVFVSSINRFPIS